MKIFLFFVATLISFPLFICSGLSAFAETEPAKASKAKAMNPDIGINMLGLFSRGQKLSNDRTQVPRNGLRLQETEMQFSADVDPYFKASALFSLKQESGGSGYSVDPEEIYMETLSLPSGTLRAGKFKLGFGKHNTLHTHAYPFINSPLIQETLFGDEGINEVGVSASVLIPNRWFTELTLQGFTCSNSQMLKSPESGEVGGLIHFKNLWDLTEDLTFETGLSGLLGQNSTQNKSTAFGLDITFKWRPSVGGKYQSLSFTTELIHAKRRGFTDSNTGLSTENQAGVASWLQYQFAQRWWAQVRFDKIGISASPGSPENSRMSMLLGFFPSEFSGIRLQFDHVKPQTHTVAEHTLLLQYNISIGAHPAHAY